MTLEFDWNLPYPSARSPVFADHCVATSQPLATEAGIAAMRSGGNAVDAALASAITLTVVEPCNNGLGSDAFALIWDGSALHGLNASGRSPRLLDPARYSSAAQMPSLGWHSVTVPGAVSAWSTLSSRFGVLPFHQLFETAIHYAESGFPVGPKTAYFWDRAQRYYRDFPHFLSTFFPDGKPVTPGSRRFLRDHAESLRKIAESKGRAFYEGELAERMVEDAQRHDFPLALDDLSSPRPDWVNPIKMDFEDAQLFEIPPNGQGLMALIALGLLKHLNIKQHPLDSASSIHLQVEAVRYAWQQVAMHLSDPATMRLSVDDLLAPEALKQAAMAIDPSRAQPLPSPMSASPDTVYLTTADRSGMMVSFIQSNFRGFGSGVVVPGTGISLQNRASGFLTDISHPNGIGPGKRPFHTIIPGFAFRQGEPFMSFGVMGGHMQAQGHVQMMIRIIGHGQNPQAASDAPRWHLTESGALALESGFDTNTVEQLRALGHDILLNQPEHLFGGAQLIARHDTGYCAASDHRKEGIAAGF